VFGKLWIEGHLWPTRKKTRPPRGPITQQCRQVSYRLELISGLSHSYE
jgi:hypothetical protein